MTLDLADIEKERDEALALARAVVRICETYKGLLVEARYFVKIAAGTDGSAVGLLERIERAV